MTVTPASKSNQWMSLSYEPFMHLNLVCFIAGLCTGSNEVFVQACTFKATMIINLWGG